MSRMPHMLSCLSVVLLLLSMVYVAEQSESTTQSQSSTVNVDVHSNNRDFETYGADVSWPMQHDIDNQHYENYMNGCYQQGYTNYEKRADGLYERKDEKDVGKKEISK